MARQARNMMKYVFRRILLMVPILLAVLIFTWIISHMMSVNPYLNKLAGVMDRQVLEKELRRVGWYDPWYVKLGVYLKNFFTGDWGESFIILPGEKVIDLFVKIWPKTIELMLFSVIIVPIIAIKLGVVSAKNKNKPKDTMIRGFAILGAGFPIFYIASLVQIFVGLQLYDFTYGGLDLPVVYANNPSLTRPVPVDGAGTGFRLIDSILYNNQIFLWDTLVHLILPVFCMIFVSLSGVTRQTRSSMLDVLDQDYVRTARAKGVKEKDVINKQSLLGSLFVEVTFNYTGMGYYFLMAIYGGDYLVINGFLVFSTIIIISGTLVADVAYTIIDPRIIY